MKYNTYNNRRPYRYQTPETLPLGKKIVEQLITQVVLCVFLLLLIIGAQRLGSRQLQREIARIKTAITYSPSLDELTENTKSMFTALVNRVKTEEKIQESVPVILIDNEVF